MTPALRLTAAVLGTPDPRGLARFYGRLLGWPLRDPFCLFVSLGDEAPSSEPEA